MAFTIKGSHLFHSSIFMDSKLFWFGQKYEILFNGQIRLSCLTSPHPLYFSIIEDKTEDWTTHKWAARPPLAPDFIQLLKEKQFHSNIKN